MRENNKLTIYRDDSTARVVYTDVKTYFWTCSNTVMIVSRYNCSTGEDHYYVGWPREQVCWYKYEPYVKPALAPLRAATITDVD